MVDIIEVAVHLKLDSFYSYLIPPDFKSIDIVGKRVLVDFRGRKLRGYAVEKKQKDFTEKQLEKIKPIKKKSLINLKWILHDGSQVIILQESVRFYQ